MKLNQSIVSQLEQLATNGPQHIEAVVQSSPQTGYIVGIPATGKGAGASLSLADYDRYSVILRHLEVYDNSIVVQANTRVDYLRSVAAAITQRLTYLEEPLALIEVDAIENMAQLRSSPPQCDGQGSIYWELVVRVVPHPQVRLTRYGWTAAASERTLLPHPITFATLGRVAEDLAVSLAVIVSH